MFVVWYSGLSTTQDPEEALQELLEELGIDVGTDFGTGGNQGTRPTRPTIVGGTASTGGSTPCFA